MFVRNASYVAGVASLLALSLWSQQQTPSGISKRVRWTTSRVVGSPDPPSPYRLTRAYPQFSFKEPVFIAQDPTSDRLFVAEYKGTIYSFQPGDASGHKSEFLKIKRGISAFSFHPQYRDNGYVFVFSHLDPNVKRTDQLSRIFRYQLEPGSDPPRLRPESETMIIEWPAGGHNGGEAIIGPDGYLYITTGDGSGGSDRKSSGQGVDDLLAVMMRLDVDHADAGRNYSIPKDNPFVDTPGARPEIWAYGFRNPWRFSFDFEHLASLTNLRVLDLGFTQIDDDGFEHLAALTKLEKLVIGGNRLTGACLPLLKLLPALRDLDVGGIQRVDSGLWGLPLTEQNLARIGELKQLRRLGLARATLADRGTDRPGHPEAERSTLPDLSALNGLVNLEYLDLTLQPVTPEAVRSLKIHPAVRMVAPPPRPPAPSPRSQ